MSKVDNEVKKSMLKTKIITLISATAAIMFIQVTAVECAETRSIDNSGVTVSSTAAELNSHSTETTTTTTTAVTTTTTTTTTSLVPFDTKRVGNEKIGFIDVPKSWRKIEEDSIEHDDYIEYSAVYNEDTYRSINKNDDLEYSSIAIEYGELGETNKEEFLEAEARQFSAMNQYFNSSNTESIEIIVDDEIQASDYFTKHNISGEDTYRFETKIKDYYKDVGYGDGFLTVYIMFLPDKTYRAITVESNTSEKFLVTKLISTYTLNRKAGNTENEDCAVIHT